MLPGGRFTLTKPDDWHLHVRDGEQLPRVVPDSARRFGRAIIMPNLQPPITLVKSPWQVAASLGEGDDAVIPFRAGETVS